MAKEVKYSPMTVGVDLLNSNLQLDAARLNRIALVLDRTIVLRRRLLLRLFADSLVVLLLPELLVMMKVRVREVKRGVRDRAGASSRGFERTLRSFCRETFGSPSLGLWLPSALGWKRWLTPSFMSCSTSLAPPDPVELLLLLLCSGCVGGANPSVGFGSLSAPASNCASS
jgi:hypothetical protein